MYDAIIIGAGPAGTATAVALGRYGRKVLLLDRAHFPRDKVCGECLSPAAVPLLNRLGVLGALSEAGAYPYYGFRLIAANGAPCDLLYPSLPPAPPYGYCLPRRSLDGLLLARASREPSVQVLEGFHVQEARRDRDGCWQVDGLLDRRERHAFTARVVVAADGRHSSFLPPATAPRPSAHQRLCLVGTFGGVAAVEPLIECGVVGRGLQYLIGPQGHDTAVICAVVTVRKDRIAGSDKSSLLRNWLDQVPSLRSRLSRAEARTPVRGMAIRPYLTPRLVDDGLVLVGDTTGFIDPITGEGMFRALWGAERAAQVLHQALAREDITRRALLPYEVAMQVEFRWVYRFVRLCAWATDRPWLINRVVRRLQNDPDLRSTLAAVQGALLPFSWRILARLVGSRQWAVGSDRVDTSSEYSVDAVGITQEV